MTVEEQILQNAIQWPERIALITPAEQVTYAQLWERCLLAATNVKRKYGLKKGDRIILSAAGNIDFIYAYFGIHLAGGICVPIDPDTNETRFELIKQSTMPVCTMGVLQKVTGTKTIPFNELLSPCEEVEPFQQPEVEQIADVLFTTGTTGAPKGVALNYRNLAAAALNINTFVKNTANDVELLALPVSHSFGLGRIRCVLSKGGSLVLLGTFASMKRFFGQMEQFHCTGFAMVPAGWGYIKKMSGRKIGQFADKLRYIEIGSSFMSVEDKELLLELLPKTRICMHYGLTEASRSAFMEFHSEHDQLNTAGKASPNVEVKIFDSEGNLQPIGAEGEVCVKGKHVTCSYWNETPERFAQDFFNGYFRTGDCGYLDEMGYIHLKSRIKEMINVGGKKVSPMEVEAILNTIPGIEDSACVAMPDPEGVMGELVKAFIVCKDENLTDAAIIEILKPKLEMYKLPAVIERIDVIPKTASGKIQRLNLKVLGKPNDKVERTVNS